MTEFEAIAALIDHETAHYKRLPHFPAVVVKQNGDLTVDVQPDSPYLPGLSALPLRTFVPGAVTKVAAGSRVQVVFENGDPKRPAAVPDWDQGAGELLQLAIPCGDIRLGDADADDAAVLGSTWKEQEDGFDDAMKSAFDTAIAALNPPPTTAAQVGSILQALLGSMKDAQSDRQSARASALSSIVKISS